ncbi:hypothetical protein ACRAWG_22205 [Methylobacterium sp. P31]
MLPDSAFEPLGLPRVGTSDASDLSPIVRRTRPRVTPLGTAVLLRAMLAVLTFALLGALAFPAMARADGLRLRGDVTARGDVLTLADLVEGAPAALAGRPLFRSPALGATGTIQTRRIVDAATALGLTGLETGGRLQIAVQRAARRLGPPEIEAALKHGLETGFGLDPRSVAVRFDGDGPTLLAPLEPRRAGCGPRPDLRSALPPGLGARQPRRTAGLAAGLRRGCRVARGGGSDPCA